MREEYQQKQYVEQFSEWLVQHAGERPILTKSLATAPEASLRELAVPAIEAHPSPENRRLLEQLFQDDEPLIRAAAGQVQKVWKGY